MARVSRKQWSDKLVSTKAYSFSALFQAIDVRGLWSSQLFSILQPSMPAAKSMGDGNRVNVEMASLRVAEFSDALDWRPMQFQEPNIAQRACVLCGVVYKKAIRLPCFHILCVKCHAQCGERGSACPVDQELFGEDDIEELEASFGYILKRKVVCWNAPRGCSFIGPAACLLDHYKDCEFSTVSCCLCHSSVLQRNTYEHFKSRCSLHQETREPLNDHTTQDLKEVSGDCLEIKTAIEKISEDLMLLQTSLNRCSEEARLESARSKAQLEAEASGLTEQLNDHSTMCTTGVVEELKALQVAMADYKEHVSKELGLLNHPRPERVHWYIECWADLKKEALEKGLKSFGSPTRSLYNYRVSQTIRLKQEDGELRLGSFMKLYPGHLDLQLEWPFRKSYTVGIIHPEDELNVIFGKINPSECEDQKYFQRPKGPANNGFGVNLSTAEKLEEGGFIHNNTLHVFLEIEP